MVDHTFHQLTLELDTGTVKIKFRPDLAPNHVQRIGELANEGFYNGVPFHRVIPGFMAQGGDGGNKNGTGGSKKSNLKQEFSAEPHVRGVCSMARMSASGWPISARPRPISEIGIVIRLLALLFRRPGRGKRRG